MFCITWQISQTTTETIRDYQRLSETITWRIRQTISMPLQGYYIQFSNTRQDSDIEISGCFASPGGYARLSLADRRVCAWTLSRLSLVYLQTISSLAYPPDIYIHIYPCIYIYPCPGRGTTSGFLTPASITIQRYRDVVHHLVDNLDDIHALPGDSASQDFPHDNCRAVDVHAHALRSAQVSKHIQKKGPAT